MIRWSPLSPKAAVAGLPALSFEEGYTDVARRPRKLRPFGVVDVTGGRSLFFELIVFMVTAISIVWVLRVFIVQPFYIPSGSMLPQLVENDRILVNKLAYKIGDPHRGDVVVFHAPAAARQFPRPPEETSGNPIREALVFAGRFIGFVPSSTDEFVKRVIALPGETVQVRNGEVFIDGKLLDEPYLTDEVKTLVTGAFGAEPVKVPEGHIWVMGDNRPGSSDSRVFGTVPIDSVVGRAFVKVWPFHDVSFL